MPFVRPEQDTIGLRIQTLGRFAVLQHGREICFSRAKDRALIAFLAVNKDRAYTRDFLADLFWSNATLVRARHSLNQSLYEIRRLLPRLLITDSATIQFAGTVEIDVLLIRAQAADGKACAAVHSIPGAFLTDIVISGAPDFDSWKADYWRSFTFDIDHALAHELAALTDKQKTEFSLRVSAHSRETFPCLDLPRPLGPLGRERNFDSDGFEHPAVAQRREHEIAALDAAWGSVNEGFSRFVIVCGRAGYGKTTILNHFGHSHRESATVVQCACYEAERSVSLAAVNPILREFATQEMVATLEPVWAASLAKLLPLNHQTDALPRLSDGATQLRLFEAVLQLIKHICAQQPLIWLIDDVHWADSTTRALLSYVSRNLPNSPLLIIAACRTTSRLNKVPSPWDRWNRVELREFAEADLAELINAYDAGRSAALGSDRLGKLTDGHPYLVFEVLRQMKDAPRTLGRLQNARSLHDYILASLETLSARQQRTVSALAIIGKPTTPELLSNVAGSASSLGTLRTLAEKEVIRIKGYRIGFRHDLLREVAYKSIPRLIRKKLHRRCATALARMGRKGEAAVQFYKGSAIEEARRYALTAFEESATTGAHNEAIYYLKLNLRTQPTNADMLRRELAIRLARMHRLEQAQAEVVKLLQIPTLGADEVDELTLFHMELAIGAATEERAKIHDTLSTIVTKSENESVRIRAIRLLLRISTMHGDRHAGDMIGALRDFGMRNLHSSYGIESLCGAIRAQTVLYSTTEAQEWAEALSENASDIGDPELLHRVWGTLADLAYARGQLRTAEQINRRALASIEAVGALSAWSLVKSHIHMLTVEQGRYMEAQEIATQIRRRPPETVGLQTNIALAANEALMHYELGNLDASRSSASAALSSLNHFPVVWVRILMLGLIGKIAFDNGSISEAQQAAQQGMQLLDTAGMRAADISDFEILIARLEHVSRRTDAGLTRLMEAIADYRDRDVVCRLKMQLELARLLKHTDRKLARQHANDVFTTASAINARPLADRADSLLHRL